jgi:hypothetical protein
MKLDRKVREALQRRERIRHRPHTLPPKVKEISKQVTLRSAASELLPVLSLPPDVNCGNCNGACCRHMGYPPFWAMYTEPEHAENSDPEWIALMVTHPELAMEARQGAIDHRGDQELPCIWLDLETNRCKHYKHRPQVCRDFEERSDGCLDHRQRLGLPT